ncbi:MAG TPA: glutamate formimidoyltransferase [Blastocatellia bacterium]|nr:glutamate formimidoyltransferase [Blastocatellia bacterium]
MTALRKIVECIPNFSEGRNSQVIDEVVAAIQSVAGAVLLDRESDADHNRSVVTFVAPPEAVVDAALAGARRAAELIDLNRHTGEHPRMGATDVIPFVPISGVTMEDCVALARSCGERMWRELQIPVYLYEKAATRTERENLANLRKGQFEGIRDEIATKPARQPDYGEARLHPTAGITAVGARPPLIAYNINLGTADVEVANKIARAVRHLSGGLRYVKALGFELKDCGQTQVSMNMVNYEGTPLFRAFEMVKREAERYGVPVVGSEIVGLVPQAALNDCSDFYLQLENFSAEQILENRLQAALESAPQAAPLSSAASASQNVQIMPVLPGVAGPELSSRKVQVAALKLSNAIGLFPDMVAAATPTPGGGSVAAHAGVLAAALGEMVCNLTMGKPKYTDRKLRLQAIRVELAELGGQLRELIAEDADSFEAVLKAYRLPKETDEQKVTRNERIQSATLLAINVPMRTAAQSLAVLKLLRELADIGNPNALSDAAVGAQLAHAAIKGASYNVQTNLGSLTDQKMVARCGAEMARVLREAQTLADEVDAKAIS